MRACHVVYAEYPEDPRVRREIDSLRIAGHEVDVICLQGEGESLEESIHGVHVSRVPLQARRGSRGRYLFQYALFFALSTVRLMALHRRKNFDAVHVHSLPDFQVFCTLALKLSGVPVILDLHEALPEIVAARFHLESGSPLVRLARFVERASVFFADRVLTVNETVRDLVAGRLRFQREIVVIMNSPDLRVLLSGDTDGLKRQLGLKEGPTIVYVGGINAERDLATLLRAVSLLRGRTEIQVVIAGHGDPEYVESLKALASGLPISNRVIFLPRIPQEQVLSYLALASLGVICYQENPLTEIAIPTKAFEYAAAGKPLAIARLRALARLFEGAAEFFRPGDVQDLALAIERLITNPAHSTRLVENARAVLSRCSWDIMESRLLSVYRQAGEVSH